MAAAFGNTIAQIVSIKPKFLTTKYVGIKPPSKNIVNTNITVKKFRPTKSFLTNAEAAGNVTAKLIEVPKRVYKRVFKYPHHISEFSNINLYPSKVISFGHNQTFPELTAAGLLIDALIIYINGYNTIINAKNKNRLLRNLNILSPLVSRVTAFICSPLYHRLVSLVFLAK